MALLRGVLEKTGIQLQCLRSSVVSPRSFNRLVRQTDSKGSIPLQSLGELITSLTRHIQDQEYIQITVDRLGGRWHYAERMRDWFADLEIRCVEETASVSRYQVGDNLEIAFVVEADQTSLPVALASMLSKYLRELFMGQFNAWFRGHQPEIAPTAGYPMDSHRFWADAEPTRNRLGLRNEDWWRER
jgi:ribonuclease HII